VFTKQSAVLMEARFVDGSSSSLKLNDVGWWWKEWFYKRIQRVAEANVDDEELIPTMSYIFRHDRAVFWTLRDQFPESVGNNPVFRVLFGWLLPPQVTFLKLPAFTAKLREEMRSQRVYQDIVLPMKCLPEAVDLAFNLVGISPILVYPSRVYDNGPGKRGIFPTRAVSENLVSSSRGVPEGKPRAGMFFDLGVYGIPLDVKQGRVFDGVNKARLFEDFTRRNGGGPFLYAQTFFTKSEFEHTFDLELYRQVRKRWGCEGKFVDLYHKISSDKKG